MANDSRGFHLPRHDSVRDVEPDFVPARVTRGGGCEAAEPACGRGWAHGRRAGRGGEEGADGGQETSRRPRLRNVKVPRTRVLLRGRRRNRGRPERRGDWPDARERRRRSIEG